MPWVDPCLQRKIIQTIETLLFFKQQQNTGSDWIKLGCHHIL